MHSGCSGDVGMQERVAEWVGEAEIECGGVLVWNGWLRIKGSVPA